MPIDCGLFRVHMRGGDGGALRFRGKDGSVGSLGRDGGAARGWSYGPIGTCLQRGKGRRVDIEPLFCVFILAQLEVVVDVGTGVFIAAVSVDGDVAT